MEEITQDDFILVCLIVQTISISQTTF